MARLLIIPGDNPSLRTLPSEVEGDFDVQVLESANDALWEIRQSPPEVVVADINLPGMSGLDLAEIIPGFGVPTRIVLWSRSEDRQLARQAENAGVHHFLQGAVDLDELKSVLRAQRDVLGGTLESEDTTPVPTTELAEPALEVPEPTMEAPEPVAPQPEPTPSRTPPPVVETVRTTSAAVRAEASSAQKPVSSTSPVTTSRGGSRRRREGPFVLTADDLPPIRSRMEELQQDVGAQCILLADRAGMMLTEVGKTANLPTMILLPLLSTTFSTAGQISQVLREHDSNALYMQEGTHFDLYCFDLLQRFMIVLIFDKDASATKIGSVWVYAKRAIRDIQELLS